MTGSATRIRKTLEYAFLQKRMFRDIYAGTFHIFIFSGFLVLLVRTISMVLEGSFPGSCCSRAATATPTRSVKDVFEVLVLVGVAWRFSAAPSRDPSAST